MTIGLDTQEDLDQWHKVQSEREKPFGYLLAQDAAPNGFVFITVEQAATYKDEFQHLLKPIYE